MCAYEKPPYIKDHREYGDDRGPTLRVKTEGSAGFPFRRPRTTVYKTAVAADRYLVKVALYVLRESAV